MRRSILVDSKADLLVYGNAERAIVEVAHRLARCEAVHSLTDIRGTAFMVPDGFAPQGFMQVDSTEVDRPGRIDDHINPYLTTEEVAQAKGAECVPGASGASGAPGGSAVAGGAGAEAGPASPAPAVATIALPVSRKTGAVVMPPRDHTVIRLPAYEQVKDDPVRYAHASRTFHLESNPGNARALVQAHGERDVWLNPPPVPLTTAEMDYVYGMPFARAPHPSYGSAKIPAEQRFSADRAGRPALPFGPGTPRLVEFFRRRCESQT